MVNFESMFTSLFGVIHSVTSAIRDMIIKMAPEYATLIMLGACMVGAFFLDKKHPSSAKQFLFLPQNVWLFGLIFFLILRFV
jgi:hypothetical protein